MPTPLSAFDPTLTYQNVSIGSRSWTGSTRNSPFHLAPVFGQLAMDLIAEWSLVEADIVVTVSKLSGGPTELMFDIYTRLNSSGPKSAFMLGLIEGKLKKSEMDLYYAIKRFSEHCEKYRNKCAHGIWGFINNRYDVVLLLDPIQKIKSRGRPSAKHIYVWTEKDFRDIIKQYEKLSNCYRTLKKLALTDDAVRDQLVDALRREPEIALRIKS